MPTTAPLQYPLINGSIYSWSSIELKIAGLIFRGFKSINRERMRDRPAIYGNSPDPIAKPVGKNSYTCDAEVYLAEWNNLMTQLGPGYGDVFFPIYVSYVQNGLATIQDQILGCTLDGTTVSEQEGTDPLVRKVTFNPLKILFNGVDDLAVPLTSPPQ